MLADGSKIGGENGENGQIIVIQRDKGQGRNEERQVYAVAVDNDGDGVDKQNPNQPYTL